MAHKRTLPTINEIKEFGRCAIFRVESIDLTFANAQRRTYYRLAPKEDAVTVVAYDDDQLYLISEFGAGTLDYELGFVRGGIDSGEGVIASAERELAEECALSAQHYHHHSTIYNSTGYQTGKMHIVFATGLSQCENPPEGDEPEPLEVVRWPLKDLDALLTHPRFRDSRNLVALYRLRDYLREQGKL